MNQNKINKISIIDLICLIMTEKELFMNIYFPMYLETNFDLIKTKTEGREWREFLEKYAKALWNDFCDGYKRFCEGDSDNKPRVQLSGNEFKKIHTKVYFHINPNFHKNEQLFQLFVDFMLVRAPK